MDEALKNAYAEVNQVLDILGNKYKKKVPYKIRKLFKEKQNPNYKINGKIQEISKNALIIISILNLKYWEKDPEKIKVLKDQYNKNEIEYQQKINIYKQKNWLSNRRANTHKQEWCKENNFCDLYKKREVEEMGLQKLNPSMIDKIRLFFKRLFNLGRNK